MRTKLVQSIVVALLNHWFRDKDDTVAYASFGNAVWAALVMKLDKLPSEDVAVYRFVRRPAEWLNLCNPKDWLVVPFEGSRHSAIGIVLEQAGVPIDLSKHCLLRKNDLTPEDLKRLALHLNIENVNAAGDDSDVDQTLTLIGQFFEGDGEPDGTCERIKTTYYQTEPEVEPDFLMEAVFEDLDADDKTEFKEIKTAINNKKLRHANKRKGNFSEELQERLKRRRRNAGRPKAKAKQAKNAGAAKAAAPKGVASAGPSGSAPPTPPVAGRPLEPPPTKAAPAAPVPPAPAPKAPMPMPEPKASAPAPAPPVVLAPKSGAPARPPAPESLPAALPPEPMAKAKGSAVAIRAHARGPNVLPHELQWVDVRCVHCRGVVGRWASKENPISSLRTSEFRFRARLAISYQFVHGWVDGWVGGCRTPHASGCGREMLEIRCGGGGFSLFEVNTNFIQILATEMGHLGR